MPFLQKIDYLPTDNHKNVVPSPGFQPSGLSAKGSLLKAALPVLKGIKLHQAEKPVTTGSTSCNKVDPGQPGATLKDVVASKVAKTPKTLVSKQAAKQPSPPGLLTSHVFNQGGSSSFVISKITVTASITLAESASHVVALIPTFASVLVHFSIPEIDLPLLEEYLVECINEFTRGNREELARLDSLDFVLPDDSLKKDIVDLVEAGSLHELARVRHEANASNRFNLSRCNEAFGDYPCEDLDRLRRLATEGSQILLPEDFIRQPVPGPMRTLASRLGNTYLKHAYKLYKSGNVLLFNLSDIPPHIYETLNFGNNVHWTVKPDDIMGRLLTDPNNPADGYTGLNTDETFDRAEIIYGKMSLPNIIEFVVSIVDYADAHSYPLADMRIYKEDIKGAFAHSKINPSCVWLTSMMMTSNIVMVYLYGYFGYHAQPLIFAVFSRMLKRAFTKILIGLMSIYVDDLMGFAHFSIVNSDQKKVQDFILKLLGNKGLAPDNTLPTTSADIIGWRIDLIRETIRPNDKGIRKMFFTFFFLIQSHEKYWPLQHVQIIASLTERYSLAIIGMRAFVDPFNKLLSHSASLGADKSHRRISASARFALLIWRAVILIIKLNPNALSVPLRRLHKSYTTRADYSFVSDAADSIGLAVYNNDNKLVFTTSYKLPFNAHDSKYQNAREFMGFLLALLVIKMRFNPPMGATISIKGDNQASLSWVITNKASSSLARIAFLAYSWVIIIAGFHIQTASHIAGASAEMKDIDALSRNKTTYNLDSSVYVDTSSNEKLNMLFRLCDPTLDSPTQPDLTTQFQQVIACITNLFSH